ncbi:excisionase family DNA-binding protein [Amycolatopsis minnesotensis]|uniref:Helix-turn-helix domain-containing protein n=1 Tax=Amycolatopsis minnesotensis TaxID=337894 RepID=A0ABN2SCK0_9PSEU
MDTITHKPRELLSVEAAAEQLSIGRTTMFALIKAGQVATVRVGRRRLVPKTALITYIEQLSVAKSA